MKLSCFLFSAVASSMVSAVAEEPIAPVERIEMPISAPFSQPELIPNKKHTNSYFKVGGNLIYGSIAFGSRTGNYELGKAHDQTLNIYALGWILPAVSYKYSYLSYKKDTKFYVGLGLEAIALFVPSGRILPLPNLELIFGKEHDGSPKWTQVGINLLPLTVGVIGLIERGPFIEIAAAACISAVSVSWAF